MKVYAIRDEHGEHVASVWDAGEGCLGIRLAPEPGEAWRDQSVERVLAPEASDDLFDALTEIRSGQ